MQIGNYRPSHAEGVATLSPPAGLSFCTLPTLRSRKLQRRGRSRFFVNVGAE